MRRLSCLMAVLVLVGGAWGQEPSAPPVADWTDIETVVVHASAPAPALWRVSKGDSEVWIFGTLGPLPKDFVWNKGVVAEKIAGAKRVYLPATARASAAQMGWYLLTHWRALAMPDGRKMADTLSPETKARYEAVLKRTGLDGKRYETRKPQVAAMMLAGDYLKARDLTGAHVEETVVDMAGKAGVKVRPLGEYDAMPLVREVLDFSAEAGQVCLVDAIEDIETWDSHARPAAEAWAAGDLDAVKAHYSEHKMEQCIAGQAANYAILEKRALADALKAIDAALASPGKTVIMVDIGRVLRHSGLIAALSARGLTIEQVSR